MTTFSMHDLMLRILCASRLDGPRSTRALGPCAWAPAQALTTPPSRPEPRWWRGHSPTAVAVIVLFVSVSIGPCFAGYLLAPPGWHFIGPSFYAEDAAQHEAWAAEMRTHLRYQNLLTPEPTPRGWFVSPLELVLGLAQRATALPYTVLVNALWLACAPALACGLMTVARRAGLSRPG